METEKKSLLDQLREILECCSDCNSTGTKSFCVGDIYEEYDWRDETCQACLEKRELLGLLPSSEFLSKSLALVKSKIATYDFDSFMFSPKELETLQAAEDKAAEAFTKADLELLDRLQF
jgi:hypothetical protein